MIKPVRLRSTVENKGAELSTPARSQLISVSADFFDCGQAFLPIVASRSKEGLGMAVSYAYCVTEPVMWCLHLRSSITEKGENTRAHRWCPATREKQIDNISILIPLFSTTFKTMILTKNKLDLIFQPVIPLFSFNTKCQVINADRIRHKLSHLEWTTFITFRLRKKLRHLLLCSLYGLLSNSKLTNSTKSLPKSIMNMLR